MPQRNKYWLLARQGAIAMALASLVACQQDDQHSARDLTPFLQLARQAHCADIRNRVFEIDNPLVMDQPVVLLDRSGNCADAAYAQRLYGDSVDEVLCSLEQTIAGEVRWCSDISYAPLFSTMTSHLDDPRLGLGVGFVVRETPVR